MILAGIRIFLVFICFVFICVFGVFYCLFSPRNPSHTAIFSRFFSRMSFIFGIKVEVRHSLGMQFPKNCIYIANHQNNYDMVTLTYAVQPRTITIGKKSVLWIPLFGLLYWLSGNVLINRNKFTQSHNAIIKLVSNLKKDDISLWIFPEGTRSYGCGLLPFKISTFYAAISAKIPIVPVCVSNVVNKVNLDRWCNGLVIVEVLPPILMNSYDLSQVRMVSEYFHYLMKIKISELNDEIIIRGL